MSWKEWEAGRTQGTLLGGFACWLTADERNEWHEYVVTTPEYRRLINAECRWNALEGSADTAAREVAAHEHEESHLALYVVGKAWYAGLVSRRKETELD